MPRIARRTPGGLVYHVLNRANGKLRLFKKDQDFEAFEKVLQQAWERTSIRVLGWCLMSNHWHLVLWPERDGQLTAFMRWLTLTHAQRWKQAHGAVGHGHLYQGRFKSFPIESDRHLLTDVLRVLRDRAALTGDDVFAGLEDLRAGRRTTLTADKLDQLVPSTKRGRRSTSN